MFMQNFTEVKNLLEDQRLFLDRTWSKLYNLSRIFENEKFLNAYVSEIRDEMLKKENDVKDFLKKMESTCQN